jgi:hypothetical protein
LVAVVPAAEILGTEFSYSAVSKISQLIAGALRQRRIVALWDDPGHLIRITVARRMIAV